MNTFKFGKTSEANLADVHPDLVRVARRALELSQIDFSIIDGGRTEKEQEHDCQVGVSQTHNSRHLIKPDAKLGLPCAHALDFAAWINGQTNYDWPYLRAISDAFKMAARELNIPIEWGGDWKRFKDGPHIQLPWSAYP